VPEIWESAKNGTIFPTFTVKFLSPQISCQAWRRCPATLWSDFLNFCHKDHAEVDKFLFFLSLARGKNFPTF
jgi:hypothetical protein